MKQLLLLKKMQLHHLIFPFNAFPFHARFLIGGFELSLQYVHFPVSSLHLRISHLHICLLHSLSEANQVIEHSLEAVLLSHSFITLQEDLISSVKDI